MFFLILLAMSLLAIAMHYVLNVMLGGFSKCDVNSPRRPGPNGEGEEEAR